MSIAQEIREIIQQENRDLLNKLEQLSDQVKELQKTQGDTVSIKGACNLLKCDRSTFYDYRKVPGLIEPCGGTETRPVFYKADVLSIRQKLKKGLKAA